MAMTSGMTRLRQAMANARKMDAANSAGNSRIESAMRNAAALDRRQEEARQRLGTVQSMKNRRLELDERSLGKPLPTMESRQAARSANRQAARSAYGQTQQPGKSLMGQATGAFDGYRQNFDNYNRDYDRDMDAFTGDVAQVTMLRNMGVYDPAAEQALQNSRSAITGTQAQWGTLMRQTLDELGQETEEKLREMVAQGEGTARYRELYREMFEKLGADMTRDLTEYVRQQENAKTMEKKQQAAADYGRAHGVRASVASVPKRVLGGVTGTLDTFRQGAERLFSGSNAPVDWNTPAQTMGREASAIRGSVSRNLDEKTGNGVASFLYNTGMSMVDSAAVLPLGGWGSVVLGTAAANDAMQQAKANGATDDQAIALGTISGVAEVLTEKVSIDSLFSLAEAKTARQVMGNIVRQAMPEASEEAISSVVNLLADRVIMGEKSRYEQLVQAQMEQNGLNRDQASARAFLALAGEVGMDALGGAISGGLFAAGKAAGQAVGRGVSKRISGQDAIDDGESAGREAEGMQEPEIDTAGMQEPDLPEQTEPADLLNDPIQNTMEELNRQRRAAEARTETERTGILAGAAAEQIQQAERVGELVGREVVFFSEGKNASGGVRNGYYNPQDGRIYINANSRNPGIQVISHELTHSLEASGEYTSLRRIILQKIAADGGNLDALRAEKQALYRRNGVQELDVDAEIVAEYVEQNLLTDEASIRELVEGNRTLGQRIMEFIDRLLARLGNKNARERAFLSRARGYYQNALAESHAANARAQEQVRRMERLQEQMAAGEITEEEAWEIFNEIYDPELDLQNGLRGNRYSYAGEGADVPEMANAEVNTVGAFTNGSQSLEGSAPTINSASKTSISENGGFGNREFSISEAENLSELDRAQLGALESLEVQTRKAENDRIRQALPTKAREYLARTERVLMNKVTDALGVDKFSDKYGLQETVREISNEYLKNGKLTREQMDALFEKAYRQGIVIEKEFYRRYKEIKDRLRTTAVTLDEGYRSSIPDYRDFRQSAFGRLRLVNEGGRSVDSLYQELQQEAPELFPYSISNPADQLMQMFEVAKSIQISERTLSESMGRDAAEFRRWAKNDFESALDDMAYELRNVKRYAQERAEKAQEQEAPTTPEEAARAYGELKKARWAAEKAKAGNLLTDSDRMKVGRLLKGEIELSDLEDGDNAPGIRAVYEASKEYERLAKLLNQYKRKQRERLRERAQENLKDALLWKDKKTGIAYSRETMERNIRDIAPDKKAAEAVIRAYITPVHRAEAESTRFKNAYGERVRKMNLSRKVEKGNQVSEAYAVQLLGEARDNIRMLEKSRGRNRKRDGRTAEDWRGIIQTLREENPDLDWGRVENAVREFQTIYDELFQQINQVRVRNGYEPINYRSGYFPHFQAQGDGILDRLGRAIGMDTQSQVLPTSINGITGEFRPGITWFQFGQKRTGYETDYDAVAGFERYIKGAADVIHHTDNIQNLRALATEIRYMTGDEGMRRQMDAIREDQTLTEEEKSAKLDRLYKEGRFTLSNFVNELEEYTNLLANKKSKHDRTMEALIGRRAYTLMKNFESRVGANMVAGNLSSALTNFIPLTQAGAQIDTKTLLQGMWDTLKAYKTDDGFVNRSDFLTNRRGSDPIIQTWLQKASKVMGTPMEYIDSFTADSIVRARFRQNLRRGMSETAAMEEADSFAGHVMADRSKGAQPTLFNAANPIFKAFTQFQLEVNNQFSEVFKDLPRAYRDKGLAALAAALLKYFFGAYVFNEVYEKIVGRRPALDPIGILNDTVGDLTGYELPNLVTLAGNALQGERTSFRTEQVGLGEAGKNLAQNALGELPFSSGLTLLGVELDGGRIPASSAIPDLTALWDAATTEGWSGRKRWNEAQKELNKLAYLLPSFGGNQIGKGIKTAKQLTQGGKYTVDAEGNDVLQYPIENNAANWIRGVLLGPSSLPESQAYYDGNQRALTGEQTAVVRELEKQGIDRRVLYDLYQQLREIGKEQKGTEAGNAKRSAINAMELTDGQKLQVFAATMLDKQSGNYEETVEKYRAMLDAGLSWDEITRVNNVYAALNADDDRKATEKARELELWMDEQDWTPEQEEAAKERFKFWTMRQAEAAEGDGKYDYMKERLDSGTPPETVLAALSEGQQENYAKHLSPAKVSAEAYLDTLNFASKAETDEDGQTRKEKIVDYISGLKLTRRQKRALFLCFYSEKDDTFK